MTAAGCAAARRTSTPKERAVWRHVRPTKGLAPRTGDRPAGRGPARGRRSSARGRASGKHVMHDATAAIVVVAAGGQVRMGFSTRRPSDGIPRMRLPATDRRAHAPRMLSVVGVSVSYCGGAIRALRNVTSRSRRPASSRCSGATAPGRRRCCARSPGTSRASVAGSTPARSRSTAASLNGRSAVAVVRTGVVQVPEGRRIFGRLTVEENLRIGGFTHRDRAREGRDEGRGRSSCSPS